jgi:hypothetical protein
VFSKEEAMKEYIKLFNKITGEKDEFLENDQPVAEENEEKDDFFKLEIPQDLEGSSVYSSNAKQAQKEITEFLSTATEQQKAFHLLKDKIYAGNNITDQQLKEFQNKNNIDCI